MLGRANSIIRMLQHAQIDYVHKSEMSDFASICSAFGASSNTFAPPVVQDGDFVISQTLGAAMYVGNKAGLNEGIDSVPKAVQYMSDMIDIFENGMDQAAKDGASFKAFLEGDRCKNQLTYLNRCIKGPFFFGEKPTYVDFVLFALVEWKEELILNRLKSEKGVDVFGPYEKILGVINGIRNLDSVKNFR